MKARFLTGCFYTTILCLVIASGCTKSPAVQPDHISSYKEERIAQIKEATVRIYVDGRPRGTGFIITENGLIATAFHVIAKTSSTPHKQTHITYAMDIQVQFNDGEKLPAVVHTSCIGRGLHSSIIRDYCILEVKTAKKFTPLRIGNFDSLYEGAHIYLSGYPMISEKPRISFGKVSVKWKSPVITYHGQFFPDKKNNTDIALLDITMTRGYSGGPIVLMGKTPDDDRVVGIAAFVMTPLDQEMKALSEAIKSYAEERHAAVCTIELFQLLKKERGCKSLFISGCISINPLKLRLQNITRERKEDRSLGKFIPFI